MAAQANIPTQGLGRFVVATGSAPGMSLEKGPVQGGVEKSAPAGKGNAAIVVAILLIIILIATVWYYVWKNRGKGGGGLTGKNPCLSADGTSPNPNLPVIGDHLVCVASNNNSYAGFMWGSGTQTQYNVAGPPDGFTKVIDDTGKKGAITLAGCQNSCTSNGGNFYLYSDSGQDLAGTGSVCSIYTSGSTPISPQMTIREVVRGSGDNAVFAGIPQRALGM